MTPTIGKYRDEQSVKRPQYLLQYCWKRWQDRVRASGRPHRCRFARQMRGIRAKGCKVGDKRMTADDVDAGYRGDWPATCTSATEVR